VEEQAGDPPSYSPTSKQPMVTRNGRDPPGWWNWKAYIADYITLIVLAIITALVYVLAKPATRTLVPTDPAINFPNKPAQVPDAMLIVRFLQSSASRQVPKFIKTFPFPNVLFFNSPTLLRYRL